MSNPDTREIIATLKYGAMSFLSDSLGSGTICFQSLRTALPGALVVQWLSIITDVSVSLFLSLCLSVVVFSLSLHSDTIISKHLCSRCDIISNKNHFDFYANIWNQQRRSEKNHNHCIHTRAVKQVQNMEVLQYCDWHYQCIYNS